jgi:cold shock CspA family protein
MALTGTVKSYNPHKGWGFIECNGQDVFLNKKELKGICPTKGAQVQFNVSNSEKGSSATDCTVLVAPDEASYLGEIKSFNVGKGYGFISSEAFPGQDVFVLKTELPGGFGPQGGHCKFKVKFEAKGPTASDVQLLGAAGNQVQIMKQMNPFMVASFGGKGAGWGGKGVWKPMFSKFGKGTGKSADPTCWDLKKTGMCPRGALCKYQH